jgi:hypothetical protein
MTTSTRNSNIPVIVILAIALIAAIGYCIYLKTQTQASLVNTPHGNPGGATSQISFDNFRHPREDNDAVGDIESYRHHKGKNDPNMVIYDSADISNYFSCIWGNLTQTPPPNGYHWAVGFYFVRKYDSTKQDTVLDFYVTPTLVDSTIGHIRHVIDFDSNYQNKLYYQHDPKYPCASLLPGFNPQTGSGSEAGNSYDAGELWP